MSQTWSLNKASIIGRDHEFSKKNKQDFACAFADKDNNLIIGVVCDGCGESGYSEVGAALTCVYFTNYLKKYAGTHFSSIANASNEAILSLKLSLETNFIDFLLTLQQNLLFSEIADKISFINEFALCTTLFCVVINDMVIIGQCGDGVIIINDSIFSIDKQGRPDYLAYKSIPKSALKVKPSDLNFFLLQVFPKTLVHSVIIGSDGIQPIIDASLISELYGTKKRQLQRKFNLWQDQKMFGDDATCIVIEKQNGDKISNISES